MSEPMTMRTKYLSAIVLVLLVCAGSGYAEESQVIINDGDKVAYLGDSITAAGANYGGYCRLVVHGLKAKGVIVEPVFAGVPGNTSEHMLERLEQCVLQHKPDWVVLAAGVNDIWHSDPTVKIGVFQPKPGMGVKLDGYKKNVSAIVDRCKDSGAKVILTTITPIREDPEFKLNITARKYNAFLVQLAKERKLPIAKLNEAMFADIAGGARLTSDGVHPLGIGHRVMAKGVLRAMGLSQEDTEEIEKEWEGSPKVLILGDKQSTAGSRTGGWCHMLMDGLNSGREMVTYNTFAWYRNEVTMGELLAGFSERAKSKPRDVLLQAPRGDAVLATPLGKYRQQVEQLIAVAGQNNVRPVLVTIAVQDNDPASELSRKLEPYNDVLRDIARAKSVPLADINQAMAKQYAADPAVHLTYDGERFGHQGAILMAETLMRAMGLDSLITSKLRKVWMERPSYTRK
jgi:lysophospholipase L1-like esterase